jgi:hypothetical protein
MKKYVNESRIKYPSFQPRNLVMLNRKNIKPRHPARKLAYKMYALFEYLES